MTLYSQGTRITHAGNGLAVSFPFNFQIFEASDLAVTRRGADEAVHVLDLGVDYMVPREAINNPDGGQITLTGAAPAAGDLIVIERWVELTQDTDSRQFGTFSAAVYERTLDRLMAIAQQLKTALGRGHADSRVLRLDDGDADGTGRYRGKGNRITGLADPIDAQDGVTLAALERYLEARVVGGAGTAAPTWSLLANGILTAVPITGAPSGLATAYLVTLSGVLQQPNTDYTIDQFNETLNFSAAPPSGAQIFIRAIGLTRPFLDDPLYTTGTRPPAGPGAPRRIRVKDAGAPELYQMWLANGAGTAYEWATIAIGPP